MERDALHRYVGQLKHIATKHCSRLNIHHILYSGHVSDCNFIETPVFYANCKFSGSSWWLNHNMQTDALHVQVAPLRHNEENHSNTININ